MKTLFVALRAIFYAACFVLFWGWLARGARRYDERLALAAAAWWEPVGVALMVPGALIVLACVGTFVVRGQGTPAPFDPPTAFVPSGLYRYVRNPMYIGAALFHYNPSRSYVVAVESYAHEMRRDERAFYGYYFWQVLYRTTKGTFVLPVGYPRLRPRHLPG